MQSPELPQKYGVTPVAAAVPIGSAPSLDTGIRTASPLTAGETDRLCIAVRNLADFCRVSLPEAVALQATNTLPTTPENCAKAARALVDHFNERISLLEHSSNSSTLKQLAGIRSELSSFSSFLERLQHGKCSDGNEKYGGASVYLMLAAIDTVSSDLRAVAGDTKKLLAFSPLSNADAVALLERRASIAAHGGPLVSERVRSFAERSKLPTKPEERKGWLQAFASGMRSNPRVQLYTALTAVFGTSFAMSMFSLVSGKQIPWYIKIPALSAAGVAAAVVLPRLANWLSKRKLHKEITADSGVGKQVPNIEGGSYRTRDPNMSSTMPISSIDVIRSDTGAEESFHEFRARTIAEGKNFPPADSYSRASSTRPALADQLDEAETEVVLPVPVAGKLFFRPVDRSITSLTFLDQAGNEIACTTEGYRIREYAPGGFELEGALPHGACQAKYRWKPENSVTIEPATLDQFRTLLYRVDVSEAAREVRVGPLCAALDGETEGRVNSLVARMRERGLYYTEEPFIGWMLDHSGDAYFDVLAALGSGDCNVLAQLAACEVNAITPAFMIAGITPRSRKLDSLSPGESGGVFDLNPQHRQAAYSLPDGMARVDLTRQTEQMRLNTDVFSEAEMGAMKDQFLAVGRNGKVALALQIRDQMIERTREGQGDSSSSDEDTDAGHRFQDDVSRYGKEEKNAGKALQYMNELLRRLEGEQVPQNFYEAATFYAQNEWHPPSPSELQRLPEHLKLVGEFHPERLMLSQFREVLLSNELSPQSKDMTLDCFITCCIPNIVEMELPGREGIMQVQHPAVFAREEVARVLDSQLCQNFAVPQLTKLFVQLERGMCESSQMSVHVTGDTSRLNEAVENLRVLTRAFINCVDAIGGQISDSDERESLGIRINAGIFHTLAAITQAENALMKLNRDATLKSEFESMWKLSEKWRPADDAPELVDLLMGISTGEEHEEGHTLSDALSLAHKLNIPALFPSGVVPQESQEYFNDHLPALLLYCLRHDEDPQVPLAEFERTGFDVCISAETSQQIFSAMQETVEEASKKLLLLGPPRESTPATTIMLEGSPHPQGRFLRFARALDSFGGVVTADLLANWPKGTHSEAEVAQMLADSIHLLPSDSIRELALGLRGQHTPGGNTLLTQLPALAAGILEESNAAQATFIHLDRVNSDSSPFDSQFATLRAAFPDEYGDIITTLQKQLQESSQRNGFKMSHLQLDVISALGRSVDREELYRALIWTAHQRVRCMPPGEAAQQLVQKLGQPSASGSDSREAIVKEFTQQMQRTQEAIQTELPRVLEEMLVEGVGEAEASRTLEEAMEKIFSDVKTDHPLEIPEAPISTPASEEGLQELENARLRGEASLLEVIRRLNEPGIDTSQYDALLAEIIESSCEPNQNEPLYFQSLSARSKATAILIHQMVWESAQENSPPQLASCLGISATLLTPLMREHFSERKDRFLPPEYFWSVLAGRLPEAPATPAQKGLVRQIPKLVRELTARTPAKLRPHESSSAGKRKKSPSGSYDSFADVRQYTPGDSVSSVNWKVWGKSDRLMVNTYYESRPTQSLVMADFTWLAEGAENWKGGKLAPRNLNQAPHLLEFLRTLDDEERAGRKPAILVGGRDGLTLERSYNDLQADAEGYGALHADEFLMELVQRVEIEGRLQVLEQSLFPNSTFGPIDPLAGALPHVRPGTRILAGISANAMANARPALAKLERRAGGNAEYL